MVRRCEAQGPLLPEGCDRPHYALGYCQGHYKRFRTGLEVNVPLAPRTRRTPAQSKPYTGRSKDAKGYVRLYRPDHPNAHASGWVFEHIYVLSEKLGRPLYPDERIHHKNGVRDDNRPENLELWTTLQQPPGQRVDDLVRWAVQILRRYEPWRLR
jgi:hypothetical protein